MEKPDKLEETKNRFDVDVTEDAVGESADEINDAQPEEIKTEREAEAEFCREAEGREGGITEQLKEEELKANEEAKEDEAKEDEANEEAKAESKPKQGKQYKKVVSGVAIFLCILLLVYFGLAKYFTNHFFFGSEINSVSVSGKTVEAAQRIITSQLQEYTLNLKERGGKTEQIKAGDIGLKYSSEEEIKNFKDSQNPFAWIQATFNSTDSKKTIELSYDEHLLKGQIDKLACFDSSNVVEPKNPSFQYTNNSYVILDEVLGNKVDKDALYSQIAAAILKGKTEIDLEAAGAYIKPKYTSKSQKTIEVKEMLNKYVSTKINYTNGSGKETLDGSLINKWLAVDENLEVKFDEQKVKEFIDSLAETYNTVGKTRSFKTSSGTSINIGGGDYGWIINGAKEKQDLIAAIKEGRTLTKEPEYSQKAFGLSSGNNDIGKTYVEIDLGKQHVWFYKNGSLIVEGNVVTGNVSAGHDTPKGIYRLKYKQRNTILKGDDYAVPVSFWMPFNGGVGLHDANWRSAFGGNIYRTNGSHGCVNMPYSVAQTIFENIDVNTPVVCY